MSRGSKAAQLQSHPHPDANRRAAEQRDQNSRKSRGVPKVRQRSLLLFFNNELPEEEKPDSHSASTMRRCGGWSRTRTRAREQALLLLAVRYRNDAKRRPNPMVREGFEKHAADCERMAERVKMDLGRDGDPRHARISTTVGPSACSDGRRRNEVEKHFDAAKEVEMVIDEMHSIAPGLVDQLETVSVFADGISRSSWEASRVDVISAEDMVPRAPEIATSGFLPVRLERLRGALRRHVESGALPGFVAAVHHRGREHVDAIGTQAFGGDAPMSRSTIFRLASTTKPITAAAAMILVEECRLRLDDPVDEWLPELAGRKVLRTLESSLDDTMPAARPITVRDLLTFRSGYGELLSPACALQRAMSAAGLTLGEYPFTFTPDEFLKRLGALPLAHQPGERWLYHTAAEILGVLIARVSGQSLATFLRERIFDPLGMTDTGFYVPAAKLDRLPICYGRDFATGKIAVLHEAQDGYYARPPVFEAGGGGARLDGGRPARVRADDAAEGRLRPRAHPVAHDSGAHDDGSDDARAEGEVAVLRRFLGRVWLGARPRRRHGAPQHRARSRVLWLGWCVRHFMVGRPEGTVGRGVPDAAPSGCARHSIVDPRLLDVGVPTDRRLEALTARALAPPWTIGSPTVVDYPRVLAVSAPLCQQSA